jgi:hypothetical protein
MRRAPAFSAAARSFSSALRSAACLDSSEALKRGGAGKERKGNAGQERGATRTRARRRDRKETRDKEPLLLRRTHACACMRTRAHALHAPLRRPREVHGGQLACGGLALQLHVRVRGRSGCVRVRVCATAAPPAGEEANHECRQRCAAQEQPLLLRIQRVELLAQRAGRERGRARAVPSDRP